MSTSAPHSPLDRDSTTLAEATPWYLNETLSDEDRAWFEAELGKNDRLSNALAFDRQIAATLEQRADEVPADLGWDKLLRKVRADSAPPVAVPRLWPSAFWSNASQRPMQPNTVPWGACNPRR